MVHTGAFEINARTRNARRRDTPPAPPKSNGGSGNAKRGAYKNGRRVRARANIGPGGKGVRRSNRRDGRLFRKHR
eukprot:1945159-Lingulodinium_polyedra.AAC.1